MELIEEEDANKIEFGWDINLACASLVARSAGLLVHLNGFMLISVVVVTNGVWTVFSVAPNCELKCK